MWSSSRSESNSTTRSLGDCFVASDALPVLDAAVARIGAIGTAARGESLASRPGYVAARKLASSGSLGFPFGFAWADVDAIAAARPEIRSAETTMEPGQALLVGARARRWSSLRGSLSRSRPRRRKAAGRFLLRFQSAAKPQLSAPVFLPAAAAVPELSVPRRLGSLVLRRDVEAFWRDHEGIVAVEFDAEFAKLNSTIAAIFGVRRMDEDVLLHLAPVSQFVSARQTYSGLAANPKIAIPAFAMILQEKEPNKKVTDGFRRAFQTAVALGSAERAQKEKMALGLSEETLGDVKITFATFPDPEGSGPVDAEYNYSPAFFAKGPYIVFSTTLELARDLVKSLDAPAAIGAASPGEPSGAGPALDSLGLWERRPAARSRRTSTPSSPRTCSRRGKPAPRRAPSSAGSSISYRWYHGSAPRRASGAPGSSSPCGSTPRGRRARRVLRPSRP